MISKESINNESVGSKQTGDELPLVKPSIVAALGLLAGLSFAGWAFTGDLLLNWDQVIGQEIPVPPGFYGEGPELPRRMPLYVLLAGFSRVLPGTAVVGTLLVGSTIAAVTGMHRKAGSDLAGLAVALGYGLSPFILTRAAVGHLPVVLAAGMLPWALDAFEARDRRRTLMWAAAFGFAGPSGAVIGLVPAALSILWPDSKPTATSSGSHQPAEQGKPATWLGRLGDLALLGLTQLGWLIPSLVVLFGDATFPSSPTSAFVTRSEGVAGVLRLAAGGGFFIDPEDVANRAGMTAAALGLVLLIGGAIGLAERTKFDLVLKSGAAAALMILASIEGIGQLGWQQLTAVGPFGVARDAQKFWPLIGIALALGLSQVLRRVVSKAHRPIGLAILGLLAGLYFAAALPGLFGAGGRLVATEQPQAWTAIENGLTFATNSGATPTTGAGSQPVTVALPWVRYERLDLSEDRNVLQPAPWLLPSRVLVSGDPGLGAGDSERTDPIYDRMATLDVAVRGGAAIAPELRKLNVTHVLIAGSADAKLYRRIGKEKGVEVVVEEGDYSLYRIDRNQNDSEVAVVASSGSSTAKRSTFWAFLAGGPAVLLMLVIAFWILSQVSSYVRGYKGD